MNGLPPIRPKRPEKLVLLGVAKGMQLAKNTQAAG